MPTPLAQSPQTPTQHDEPTLDPSVLALLRCPTTREPLVIARDTDGSMILRNSSGTHTYRWVRGIAVLV